LLGWVLFCGVAEEWFWDADVKNNFSRNGPAAMNKNTHEIAFTTSIKFSLTEENYVARRQTGYRHEGNWLMHLEHESAVFGREQNVPIADGRVGFVALSLKRLTKPLISAWGRTFISGVGKANNHLRDDFAFLPIDLVFD
jgi:hypothetical protein